MSSGWAVNVKESRRMTLSLPKPTTPVLRTGTMPQRPFGAILWRRGATQLKRGCPYSPLYSMPLAFPTARLF